MRSIIKIQEDILISGHQPVEGCQGSDLSVIFAFWVKKFGMNNVNFIFSHIYNLGKIHGKRIERVRRKGEF